MTAGKSAPILVFCSMAVASRVGFMMGSWIILMHRFNVDPIGAACMSIAMQGVAVVLWPISKLILRYLSVSTSQRLGAVVGVVCCLGLILSFNVIVFICIVFMASLSKVMIESTFPRITHPLILEDSKFTSKFMSLQQGAGLVVCLVIAPITFSGSIIAPITISILLYILTLTLSAAISNVSRDNSNIEASQEVEQVVFDRRFEDIIRTNDERKPSKIGKYKRLSNTLLMIDLCSNFLGGASLALMPLVFRDISNVSQAMDSTLFSIYGAASIVAGFIIVPFIDRTLRLSVSQKLFMLTLSFFAAAYANIFYTTIFGVAVAVFAAVASGIAVITMQSYCHQVAVESMTQKEYQKFGCQILQFNSLARLLAPLSIGILASVTSLKFSLSVMAVIATVFSIATVVRICIMVRGQKHRIIAIAKIEDPTHYARELRTMERKGEDFIVADPRAFVKPGRKRIRSKL